MCFAQIDGIPTVGYSNAFTTKSRTFLTQAQRLTGNFFERIFVQKRACGVVCHRENSSAFLQIYHIFYNGKRRRGGRGQDHLTGHRTQWQAPSRHFLARIDDFAPLFLRQGSPGMYKNVKPRFEKKKRAKIKNLEKNSYNFSRTCRVPLVPTIPGGTSIWYGTVSVHSMRHSIRSHFSPACEVLTFLIRTRTHASCIVFQ